VSPDPKPPVQRGKLKPEKGLDARSGRILVEVDPRYFHPTEVELLIGDSRKAREKLGWRHNGSCVDGPRLARDHLACSAEVACSHVSGLLVQSGVDCWP
jgi:GDPmannose 4,6-dehydratase